jgi:hypothetical protein
MRKASVTAGMRASIERRKKPTGVRVAVAAALALTAPGSAWAQEGPAADSQRSSGGPIVREFPSGAVAPVQSAPFPSQQIIIYVQAAPSVYVQTSPPPPSRLVVREVQEVRDYHEGDPVPSGYQVETRARTGPIVAGGVVFGSLYFLTALGATSGPNGNDTGLLVPVAGPFIEMASTRNEAATFVLGLDGLGQAAGAALFLYGITSPKTVLTHKASQSVQVSPVALGKKGSGLGLSATF